MAYEKEQVKRVGDKVYDLLKGLSNGVGTEEITNLMSVLTAAVDASDEFRADWDAAGPHVVAAMLDRFGDERVNAV
jgi:hypothetical protein